MRKYTKRGTPLAERLRANSRPGPGGCTLWVGCTNSTGYGTIRVERQTLGAHRAAWELEHGPIPDGMHVCHRCDTRTCIEVSHMFLGTHAENMADCAAKGRNARGDRHGRAVLRDADVEVMFRLQYQGWTQKEIGMHVGCSRSNVGRVLRGERRGNT